jgi:hypothetical protein
MGMEYDSYTRLAGCRDERDVAMRIPLGNKELRRVVGVAGGDDYAAPTGCAIFAAALGKSNARKKSASRERKRPETAPTSDRALKNPERFRRPARG